jgi:hypothetical protein
VKIGLFIRENLGIHDTLINISGDRNNDSRICH